MLFADTETYSEVPIKNGIYKYSERAELLVVAYAIDDATAKVWYVTSGAPMPEELYYRLKFDTVVFHNSAFDRVVLRQLGIDIPTSRIIDTMVLALEHALPGSLGLLCDVLHVPSDKAKDAHGKKLIRKFCVPPRRPCFGDPEWPAFLEYARLDVEAMREVYRKLPKWNDERELWELDQRINDRGVKIDVELAEAALAAIESAQQRMARRTDEVTDGAVDSATRRDALLRYLETLGVKLPDMRASTIEKALEGELPSAARELLQLRLGSSTIAKGKYAALLRCVNSDGRLRGALQFCGASRTGRWAGRLFQPQNLPRPSMKPDVIDRGIEALKTGCADLCYDVIELCQSALRGVIVAPEGETLAVADLSNIEGRVLAWLAGEEWKVQAFRDFDAGRGPDIYKASYAKAFGVPVESVTEDQRQIGKVMELALGYGGGVGAFVTFAEAYGVDLDALAEHVPADPRSVQAYAKTENDFGLKPATWIALDSLKRMWRAAHPHIETFWWSLETDVCEVIDGARVRSCRRVFIDKINAWLRIRLPSGRFLCYPSIRADANGISYMGMQQGWRRIRTYGGKLAENITQAVARDILAHGMLEAEKAGFRVVLSVHDELIAEGGSAEELARCMTKRPDWALDLPLAAKGFDAPRYRK